jgi:RNA polymerase sigma-70 factor (ECF subfamily)
VRAVVNAHQPAIGRRAHVDKPIDKPIDKPGNKPLDTKQDLSPLVSAAQDGDENAFRILYRTVQPAVLRYLRTIVGDDAEDVASETWLQIARDIGSFRPRESFRAWAVTIARNRALDHLRHRRRRPAVATPIEYLAELAGTDDTGERAGELISTDAAISLISMLPRDQAEAVLLRAVVGLDAESAAKVLGKRAGAVRTACYRGLRRLAKHLDRAEIQTAEGVTQTRPPTPRGTR